MVDMELARYLILRHESLYGGENPWRALKTYSTVLKITLSKTESKCVVGDELFT